MDVLGPYKVGPWTSRETYHLFHSFMGALRFWKIDFCAVCGGWMGQVTVGSGNLKIALPVTGTTITTGSQQAEAE